MPPKKKSKGDWEDMDDDMLDEGGSSNMNVRSMSSRLRAKHTATVLAIDVGRSSGLRTVPAEKTTDFDRSITIVDWIISRKLFTESKERFSLIFFGHEKTTNEGQEGVHQNIYVHNQEFVTARLEWLKMLKDELYMNTKSTGNYINALYTSLEVMKVHAQDLSKGDLTAATITLISNFAGLSEEDHVMDELDSVANAIKKIGVQLIVIGPDLTEEPKSKAQKIGFNFIRELLARVDGQTWNFKNALSDLQFFIPKQVAPRGQPFNLELGKDFSVRVQMYVKNAETTLKLSFNPVTAASSGPQQLQLDKVRQYETVSDEAPVVKYGQIDQVSDKAFASQQPTHVLTGRKVDKADLSKAFRYGSTLVPFDKDIQQMADFPREGKQLQLIHFVPRSILLPQFLTSSPRYILPHKDAKGYDQSAHAMLTALVQAMIKKNMIALCRYAYNINSYPHLCCLIPKMTKEENYPVFLHYLMPFHDDFRYYNFPDMLSADPENDDIDYQKESLIDAYIDHMMLSSDDGKELLKKKDVHDPRIQYQCMTLRQKALTNNGKLSAEDKKALLELLSPPKQFLADAAEVINTAKEAFPLVLNEQTRMAAFAKPKSKTAPVVQVDHNLEPIFESLERGDEKWQINEELMERKFRVKNENGD